VGGKREIIKKKVISDPQVWVTYYNNIQGIRGLCGDEQNKYSGMKWEKE
jgi:hypothetical protein